MNRTQEFGAARWRRWLALTCVVLALFMAGLEATHAHSEQALSRSSNHCAICISVHANAPAAMFHSLPVLHTLEIVSFSYRTEGKGTAPEMDLFIRPPPSA